MHNEEAALALRLHPFGNHLQPQPAPQPDQRPRDQAAIPIGIDGAGEAAIDLDAVNRKAGEVGERGIAGAKTSMASVQPIARNASSVWPMRAMERSSNTVSVTSISRRVAGTA